jgi:DNA-binding CsgD family transcriptional regulator/tetratricopeptide (TPR) repeat protein
VLSGRAGERARLLAAVRDGLAGDSRVVQVHGEAGIGKTTLTRSVCAEVEADGTQVLWGQGLRFGAVDAMYHPLVMALEGWLRTASDEERAGLPAAVPSAALVLPSLGAQPSLAPSGLMVMVAALVEHIATRGPTLLVLDDAQWADPATWDATSYLVAGLGKQRLAVVTTYRDEAVVSDAFQRWLGHLRRLPRTEDLELHRLDEAATAEQVAGLTSGHTGQRLAAEVFERSRGNPYLSELLVRRLQEGATELPAELPDELSQALSDAWRGLPKAAREVSRLLAVGGRPAELRALGVVAAQLDLSTSPAVRDAIDGGVLVLDGPSVWFRHPLLATVLLETYLPGEDESAHEAWAKQLETTTSTGVDELRRLGDLALHYERAGARAAAYSALLAAAELAGQLGARHETADLYLRAVALWDAAPEPDDMAAHAELLMRAAKARFWVEDEDGARRLVRQARALVEGGDPLLVAHFTTEALVYDWPDMVSSEAALLELDAAVELTRAHPDSRERAEVLGVRAFILFWMSRHEEAREQAEASLRIAQRVGAEDLVAGALQVLSFLALAAEPARAEELAEECWRHAVASGDDLATLGASAARYMAASAQGDLRRSLELTRELSEWYLSRGLVVAGSADRCEAYLDVGELREAEAAVRTGLSSTGGPRDEARIRVFAGLLASRQGRDDAAREHLAQAREIKPDLEDERFQVRGTTVIDLFLGLGEAERAFELAEGGMPDSAIDARFLDGLLVRGAAAAAELVRRAMDVRDEDAVRRHGAALDRLVAQRDDVSATRPFESSGPADTEQPARAALFAAETARARGHETRALWLDAAQACAVAGMQWEQRCSQLRAAELMVESGAPGREVAGLLREVLAYAEQQGAKPLRAWAERLAAGARLSLAEPVAVRAEVVPAPFAALTARESEILAHLVANRTYAEIAAALFISEKTVSVHVSNLLRKTGTSSRREVSALAQRVGYVASAAE